MLLATSRDLPRDGGWLHPDEAAAASGMRVTKRRSDWLLGRWAAKRAVGAFREIDPRSVTIRAAPDGAPEAYADGRPAGCVMSLSHRGGVAVCAVARSGVELGCDVELAEPRTEAFLDDYLTPAEAAAVRARPGDERDVAVTLAWSAKESVLKAVRTGLRADTRSVEVLPGPSGGQAWSPLVATLAGDPRPWKGWWRLLGPLVITVAARPDPARPTVIDLRRPQGALRGGD
jgi:4'-phosphopantetheinyl transferase